MPSGFKRDIKIRPARFSAQILRIESLARLQSGRLRFLVTYPEALAERVASHETLAESTLTLISAAPPTWPRCAHG